MLAFCRRCVEGAIIAQLLATTALAASGITVVETDGFGTLTICRSWIVYDDCKVYNHVTLPKRVAVGDSVHLSFGSDPKQYTFPVARIVKNGIVCTVLSDDDDGEAINKIRLSSCMDVSDTH